MKQDAKVEAGALAATAATAITAHQQAISSGISNEAAIAIGGIAALPYVASKMSEFFFARFESRGRRWFADWVRLQVDDSAQAEAILLDRINDDACKEAVFEAFRALRDAIDDAVVPAIAKLTAVYTTEKLRPDSFFRGLCRVLVDLSNEDFLRLRLLLRLALSSAHDESRGPIEIGERPGDQKVSIWLQDQQTILSAERRINGSSRFCAITCVGSCRNTWCLRPS